MKKIFDILKLFIQELLKNLYSEDIKTESSKQEKAESDLEVDKQKVIDPLTFNKSPITMTIEERKEACNYISEHLSEIENLPSGDVVLRKLKYSCIEAVGRERIGKSFAKSIPYPYGWITNSLEIMKSLLYYLSSKDGHLFTKKEFKTLKEKIRDIKVSLGTLDRLIAKELITAIKNGQILPEEREMLSFSGTLLLNLDVCPDPDHKIDQWAEASIKTINEISHIIIESCKDKECEERIIALLEVIMNPSNYNKR